MLFFFLVTCSVGGFLSVTVISQTIRKVGLKPLIATSLRAAMVVPVLAFSTTSLFVDFEVPFGAIAGVIGIGMIYTLTVVLIAALFNSILGQGAVLAVVLFLVAIRFPSTGGSVLESMLPPFWQVMHNTWIGAGGLESMRSILYFNGAQLGRWLAQLLIWTGTRIVLLIVVAFVKKRRAHVAIGKAAAAAVPEAEPALMSA